jgi:hypothetical protein
MPSTSQMGPGADWRLSALQRQLLKWATDRRVHFNCFKNDFLMSVSRDVQRDRMVKHTAWLHGIREQLRT